MNKFILCIGDVENGHTFTGPFSSYLDAHDYFEKTYSDENEYRVIELEAPTPLPSAINPASTLPSRYETTDLSELVLRDQSPLHAYGYSVGNSSPLSDLERTLLLISFYNADYSVEITDIELKKDWGDPKSARRLQRIATHLQSAINLRYARKNNSSFKQAMTHWFNDLEYLKRMVYIPYGFKFEWPQISVGARNLIKN